MTGVVGPGSTTPAAPDAITVRTAWTSVEKGLAQMYRLATVLALLATALPAPATDKTPVGPELAPQEIGHLLKAYPITVQQNPESPIGVGVLLWGCDYQVGRAKITITIATSPRDPMPCKRTVAFK